MKNKTGKRRNTPPSKNSKPGSNTGIVEEANGQAKTERNTWSRPTLLDPDILSPQPPFSSLSEDDQKEFSNCEAVIKRGWQSFIEVGNALLTIREKKLFRSRYATFEDYYRRRWHYQKSHVYRLIDAAQIVATLSPIGEESLIPLNESQVRPLVGLPEDELKATWKKVSEAVEGDPERLTARLVREQVHLVCGTKSTKTPRESAKPSLIREKPMIARIKEILDSLVAMAPEKDRATAKCLQRDIMDLIRKS